MRTAVRYMDEGIMLQIHNVRGPLSRFGLDSGTWGLVLRAWFEHNGRIDLAKIVAYIDAYEKSEEERDDFGTRHINWKLAHMTKCIVSRGFKSWARSANAP